MRLHFFPVVFFHLHQLLVNQQTSCFVESWCLFGSSPRHEIEMVAAHRLVFAVAAPEKSSGGASTNVPPGLNKFSRRITQPKYQGASQAMLFATGLKPEDLEKPQVH